MAETMVTTATITALKVSKCSAQSTCSFTASMKLKSGVTNSSPPTATRKKNQMPSAAEARSPPQVTTCAPRSPIQRPKKPAMIAPSSGRKTTATDTPSPLHHVDVFDLDGAPIAVIDHQDRKADRRLRRRHRQHEHREHLPHQIVQKRRERNEVDVDREQHQLDLHQDDDDVLAIEEDAENAKREEDCGDGQVVREADLEHGLRPPPRCAPSPAPRFRCARARSASGCAGAGPRAHAKSAQSRRSWRSAE